MLERVEQAAVEKARLLRQMKLFKQTEHGLQVTLPLRHRPVLSIQHFHELHGSGRHHVLKVGLRVSKYPLCGSHGDFPPSIGLAFCDA